MSWLDIVLLVILAIAAFMGIKAGLIKSVFSLAGILLGIFLAIRLYDEFGALLHGIIANQSIANIVAFVVILLGVLLVVTVLSSFLGSMISAIGIGWLNRLGGAVFSLFFSGVVLGALLAVIAKYPVIDWLDDAIWNSFIAAFLLDKFPLVLALLPPEFDSVRNFFP